MKPLILLTLLFAVVTGTFTPVLAQAQATSTDSFYAGGGPTITDGSITSGGFVPCSGSQCSLCHFAVMANTIIKWLIGIIFLFFAILAVYAGFKLVTSGTSGGKQAAKSSFTNAFIGLFIVLAAWILIDTLLRAVLRGGNGEVNGYGPWSVIVCASQVVPTRQRLAIDDAEYAFERDFGDSGVNVTAPGSTSGGTCTVQNSGPCAVGNLGCFGSRASQASQVCSIESGGNPNSISGTDLCKDGRSFSGGLFQINILANGRYFNDCSPDFFSKNGSGAQGTCLQYKSSSSGVRYCQIRDCRVTNVTKYRSCMQQTLNAQSNIAIACRLFNASGNDFDPWITSARRCNVQ